MKRRFFLLWACLGLFAGSVRAGIDVSESVFSKVGRAKKIDPYMLYAVALAESAFHKKGKTTVTPWQFALRTSTRAYYGTNYDDTLAELNRILQTTDSVDVGLMQINVRWHRHRVRRPEDLLDVQTNVSIAADILKERLAANHNNWQQALAQYHSFDDNRGTWYASFVLGIYAQISNEVNEGQSILCW